MSKKSYFKTGDFRHIDEWVTNVWPDDAKEIIKHGIPDYRHIVKFRTSLDKPTISRPIKSSFQLVINYNSSKECFIVWNAAIQNNIHRGKRMRLPIGVDGERALHQQLDPTTINAFFREIGQCDSNEVERVLIVGKDALADFCKDYMKYIKPDETEIPKGKCCLYAIAGGEIEHIQRKDEA